LLCIGWLDARADSAPRILDGGVHGGGPKDPGGEEIRPSRRLWCRRAVGCLGCRRRLGMA